MIRVPHTLDQIDPFSFVVRRPRVPTPADHWFAQEQTVLEVTRDLMRPLCTRKPCGQVWNPNTDSFSCDQCGRTGTRLEETAVVGHIKIGKGFGSRLLKGAQVHDPRAGWVYDVYREAWVPNQCSVVAGDVHLFQGPHCPDDPRKVYTCAHCKQEFLLRSGLVYTEGVQAPVEEGTWNRTLPTERGDYIASACHDESAIRQWDGEYWSKPWWATWDQHRIENARQLRVTNPRSVHWLRMIEATAEQWQDGNPPEPGDYRASRGKRPSWSRHWDGVGWSRPWTCTDERAAAVEQLSKGGRPIYWLPGRVDQP